jgi:hypothetical protein
MTVIEPLADASSRPTDANTTGVVCTTQVFTTVACTSRVPLAVAAWAPCAQAATIAAAMSFLIITPPILSSECRIFSFLGFHHSATLFPETFRRVSDWFTPIIFLHGIVSRPIAKRTFGLFCLIHWAFKGYAFFKYRRPVTNMLILGSFSARG